MSVATSFTRIPDSAFGPAQARHLLVRAGLGATPGEVREAVERGLDATLDRLLTGAGAPDVALADPPVDPDVRRPPTEDERRAMREAYRTQDEAALAVIQQERVRRNAEDRRMFRDLQLWWLERMTRTPRPLEENLTLLWHSHFATSYRQVNDAYLMWQQNEAFRRLAADAFDKLARYIVHDPAMLKYLNNDRNRRGQPNENLARELMELFTLGEGNYAEHDIREGARALTGYHIDDNDFAFRAGAHDAGKKTILGVTGELDGDDFVRILLRREACSQFIAFKLYRHFVGDVTDNRNDWQPWQLTAMKQLARTLRDEDYAIRPVLRTLLRSYHFYDPAVMGQMIKSPVALVVGTIRSLNLPDRNRQQIATGMSLMGQELFAPPSVAGWDVGRAWINTSTLFVRQNTCAYLVTGHDPRRGKDKRSGRAFDPLPLLAGVNQKDAQAVTEALVDLLLGHHTPTARREPLVKWLYDRTGGAAASADDVTGLVTLITAMPEYQLC